MSAARWTREARCSTFARLPERGAGTDARPGLDTARGRGRALAAVRALRRRSEIRYAEPDYLMRAAATLNDPDFPLQWGAVNDGAAAAWHVTTGSPSIVIAETDTGVDYTHPDLVGNIW